MNLEHLESLRSYELTKALSLISEAKADRINTSILEIGAGAGWQAKKLAENGFAVEAIDIEDSNYAQNRVWGVTDYDGRKIPFSENHFDIVFSSNVLEHIPHLEEFNAEIHRVLKPDGRAIHIVPSASWRFWTNLAHYPYLIKLTLKIIYGRLFSRQADKSTKAIEDNIKKKANGFSKIELFRKAIFPQRHGEAGNALSEIYFFSKYRWSAVFRRDGWKIDKIVPNRLFYTGHSIFDSYLPIKIRKYASYLLGSSCHIFVLSAPETNS
jgi:2-polyprenyl-3-methyl-5-hydroxy-6-metoxy-1,4-benzoquinol methylase